MVFCKSLQNMHNHFYRQTSSFNKDAYKICDAININQIFTKMHVNLFTLSVQQTISCTYSRYRHNKCLLTQYLLTSNSITLGKQRTCYPGGVRYPAVVHLIIYKIADFFIHLLYFVCLSEKTKL